ncbi:MAG: AAA family ATPase [Candidatus Woesearchaeota archaeon]
MLLVSLELENVRSYRRARIGFPKGRVLLSGDIGAGKSTILLAVEFALFGLVRGWNDGEKLMRHGATSARVILEADIGGRIVIERSLKRSGSSIQQEEVLLEADGLQRRIMPSEARAFIIARLGYPEEFSSKQPVLFRYTVFAPQESMRQIIEERSDARLAAVRTIFGIDRYESIVRNAQIVARVLKQSSARLSGRLERKSVVVDELAVLKRDFERLVEDRDTARSKLEKAQAASEQAQSSLEAARALLEREKAKRSERERLAAERSELEGELEALIAERSQLVVEDIEVPDIGVIEARSKSVGSAIAQLDESIESTREERSERSKRMALLDAEQQRLTKAKVDVGEAQRLRSERERELAAEFERFLRFDADAVRSRIDVLGKSVERARDERTRLSERRDAQSERLASLPDGVCPTCGQIVEEDHRARSVEELKASLVSLEEDLVRLDDRITHMGSQIRDLGERLAAYDALVEQRSRLPEDRSEELETLTNDLERIGSQRSELVEQAGLLDEKLESFLEERTGRISERDALHKKLRRAEELRVRAERAKRAFERRAQIDARMKAVRDRIERVSKMMPEDDPKVAERFEHARATAEKAEGERARLSAELERSQERARACEERSLRLHEELSDLKRLEGERSRIDSVISTLSEQVPDVADRVESSIMRRILIETNDHFSRWFSVLVEDLEGYLDERFTPRIVQSGYDVSFENLSGGERTSVALAFRLALHESINHITGQSSSGLLILDEPTDGFSSEQLDAVRTVLSQLRSEQVIIVSHEPLVEGFVDSVIRIEKRADRSVIV